VSCSLLFGNFPSYLPTNYFQRQDFVIDIFRKQILDQFTDLEPEREKFIIRACQTLLVCFEMVILAIMTTMAFSYQDFRESERVGPYFKRDGIKDLTKKLVQDVLVENVVEAFEDLKELKEPLKDPFKKYKEINVEQTEIMTISVKKEKGIISDDVHRQVRIVVNENPHIIPNFVQFNTDSKIFADD